MNALLSRDELQNDPGWAWERYKLANPRGFVYNGVSHRTVWADAVRWVLARQLKWDGLDTSIALAELRLGPKSIFWPIFRDNPRLWVDCPNDGRVTVSPHGRCDACLYDFND